MVGEPGFLEVHAKHIRRGTALVATGARETDVLGGALFSAKPPVYHGRWLGLPENRQPRRPPPVSVTDRVMRLLLA